MTPDDVRLGTGVEELLDRSLPEGAYTVEAALRQILAVDGKAAP